MRRSIIVASLALLLSGCVARTATPTQTAQLPTGAASPALKSAVVDGKVLPIPGFTRGINLGNGLDAPSEGEWGVVLDAKHFEMAKAAGFDHVRLPVRFSAHAADAAPYAIAPKFFERVDWALDQAQQKGLHVILDFHYYDGLMDNPDAHASRFVGLWQQIADRYEGKPESVAFELLNEPCKNLNPVKTNALYKQVIELIRKKHPSRLIFVDSYFWASTSYLHALELPADPQLVAQFHMYQPILFTHQGASWMAPEFGTMGVAFPGPPTVPIVPLDASNKISWVRDFFANYNKLPAERNPSGMTIVVGEFERAKKYAEEYGHRVYLGEFGAIDKADPDSRFRFIQAARRESEKRGIGWCYWDDGGSFKAMNIADGTWVQPIGDALLTL